MLDDPNGMTDSCDELDTLQSPDASDDDIEREPTTVESDDDEPSTQVLVEVERAADLDDISAEDTVSLYLKQMGQAAGRLAVFDSTQRIYDSLMPLLRGH